MSAGLDGSPKTQGLLKLIQLSWTRRRKLRETWADLSEALEAGGISRRNDTAGNFPKPVT